MRENGQEYPIQFIEAAFNEETSGFELFIEFEEQIKATVFMLHLNAMAAGMDPIPLSSSHEEAAVAVLRVRQTATKTKLGYTRGTPTRALESAVVLRLSNAGASSGAAAPSVEIENMSKQLGRVEDVVGQTRDVAAEARAAAAAAASNSNEVAIKVGSIDGKIDSMKFLEEENASLKEKLAHKTTEVDRIENVQGQMTKARNQWRAEAFQLRARNTTLEEENIEIRKERDDARALLNSCRKQMDESRKTIALVRDMLQTRKRGRVADSDEDSISDSSDNN